MTYLELLAAYVTEKRPLLMEPIIINNLPTISSGEQEAYFRDIKFFNPKRTYKQNTDLKLKMVKQLKYAGVVSCGDIKNDILYTRTRRVYTVAPNPRLTEYMPGGLIVQDSASHTIVHSSFRGLKKYVSMLVGGKVVDKYVYDIETPQDYVSYMFSQHTTKLADVCDMVVPDTNSGRVELHAKNQNCVEPLLSLLMWHMPASAELTVVQADPLDKRWVHVCA